MTSNPLQIDTMRLRGRVRDASALGEMTRVSAVRTIGADPTGASSLSLTSGADVLPCGARVGVDLLHNESPEGWVEFSAPKVGTGSNVEAVGLGQAVEIAREVYEEARQLLDWTDSFEHMRVQRLDLDRDFVEVDNQDALLLALSRVKAPYNPKTSLYPDPGKANATTLTRGPAARWTSTLYSKEAEATHRLRYAPEGQRAGLRDEVAAAKGRLRFELRLRPDVMGKRLRLVQDVIDGEAELDALRRNYFDRVGYGLEVSGMDRAAAMVMQTEGRIDTRMALVGWLFLAGQGIPVAQERHSKARYARKARDLGITPADLLEVASTSARLDFDSGRLHVA